MPPSWVRGLTFRSWKPGHPREDLAQKQKVILALQAFQDRLVSWKEDGGDFEYHSTVVSCTNKHRGSMSFSLSVCLLAQEVMSWVETNAVTLQARSVPGIKNVLADQLNYRNLVVGTPYAPGSAEKIFLIVYIFATNHQDASFICLILDPMPFSIMWLDIDTFLIALIRKDA